MAAAAAALSLGGCASVYVNDAALAKKADAADSAVQAADTLKPYADQLANLKAFAAQEDAAVAADYVAQRDADLVTLLPLEEGARAVEVDRRACARLQILVAEGVCSSAAALETLAAFATQADVLTSQLSQDNALVQTTRGTYERLRTETGNAPTLPAMAKEIGVSVGTVHRLRAEMSAQS